LNSLDSHVAVLLAFIYIYVYIYIYRHFTGFFRFRKSDGGFGLML
jgi:hypothetical protein